MIAAADAPDVVGETINRGHRKEISIGSLAARILRLLAEDGVVAQRTGLRPSDSEMDRLCAHARKPRRILGREPAVPCMGLPALIGARLIGRRRRGPRLSLGRELRSILSSTG